MRVGAVLAAMVTLMAASSPWGGAPTEIRRAVELPDLLAPAEPDAAAIQIRLAPAGSREAAFSNVLLGGVFATATLSAGDEATLRAMGAAPARAPAIYGSAPTPSSHLRVAELHLALPSAL